MDLEILNQEIDDDEAAYRVRVVRRVHYLTISRKPTAVLDIDTLCRPYLLIPKLPPFPDGNWTKMRISQAANGETEHVLSWDPLDGIHSLWHPRQVDVLSLKRTADHKARVKEVQFDGRILLSKVAIFEWWIPRLQRETEFYERISKDHCLGSGSVAPTFLGHIMEQERCVGFLLEKIDGRHPLLDDHPACEAALRKLHCIGWVHGDVNICNFLVHQSTGHVKLIDFEYAEPFEETKAQLELQKLKDEFSQMTER
ncbi:hypothetical protein CH63R_13771 [Colletotrichum higginsianum IMI 349063]|uniref:Alpha-galactosidase A n=1 Tax=Colletotrichum higginsianum (strain IMI 349063) TaxID=759273 RepID=A0A1B7XS03_COLHI|nr:hypothetical protein CH63R_13771 [Colletotrichum higginsianum IMI 349063]OBR02545.1 hypothetical protein CH63R_13771 [Colletotrichum higginsianum IMI 349063]